MKKLLFSVVALATLLLAGSCQKENFGSANGNTVAYTVQLPGNIATKAIGDNVSSVTKLVYAVYRTDAQTANDYLAAETRLYQKTATLENGQTTLYLELVNNQNFRVLFWAQDPNAGIYDASNLKNVTIDYTNLDANQESYAAFAGSDFIKSGDNLSGRTVYLHRAVAQLNIATTPESMVLGEAGANETSSLVTNVTLTTSQVTVNGLASTYNVADASVGEILTADFEFDATDPSVLSEQTLDVKGVNYNYISMNYVGFAPALGTDVEVDYVIETNVGTITNTISSVPVKPNYRTNIIGNLITSTSDYTVILDEAWAGDIILVNNADEFSAALSSATSGDIINVPAGEFNLPTSMFANASEGTFTIEGSGEATVLNGARNSNSNSPGNYANGKHLVFKDLTYETANNGYNGGFGHAASVTFINCKIVGNFYAHSSAPHYFYDCTIDPLTGYLYTYASDCVFEGCTFEASEGKALQVYEDGASGENTVIIKDCAFVAAKQATTWDGKPVTGIDINSNGAIFNVTIDNCTTTGFPVGLNSDSDLWNVKCDFKFVNLVVDGELVSIAGEGKLETVSDGLLKSGVNYYVTNANGLEAFNSVVGKNVVLNILADIDFTGKTWNAKDSHEDGNFSIREINGNGKTISNFTINGQAMFSRFASLYSKVVVKDLTFDNAEVNSTSLNSAIIVGHTYQNVLLDNVDVKNSSITGGYKVASLIGTVYNESPSAIVATLKNCDVENTVVKALYYDFTTTGMVAFVMEGNNDRVEFENCSIKDVQLYAPNVYTYHAAIYCNDADTDDCINETAGVTVSNVTFQNI